MTYKTAAGTFKKLRGHGTLSEANIKDALRDVRLSLLEADVNFRVVKEFVKTVKERAVGQAALNRFLRIKILSESFRKN